jgi:hypothetical protein
MHTVREIDLVDLMGKSSFTSQLVAMQCWYFTNYSRSNAGKIYILSLHSRSRPLTCQWISCKHANIPSDGILASAAQLLRPIMEYLQFSCYTIC